MILAVEEAGEAPWYRLAYARIVQETPFGFSQPAQLTSDRTA